MKKSTKILLWLVFFVFLFLFLPAPQKSSFSSLSLDHYAKIFESEKIRQIFDLDDEEAAEVFGDISEDIFV